MSVANLELCQELYKLSKWDDTDNIYAFIGDGWELYNDTMVNTHGFRNEHFPAYDAGFLLRKLPHLRDIDFRLEQDGEDENGKRWVAYGKDYAIQEDDDWKWRSAANTPEDALCKLAIELFKQGVLK